MTVTGPFQSPVVKKVIFVLFLQIIFMYSVYFIASKRQKINRTWTKPTSKISYLRILNNTIQKKLFVSPLTLYYSTVGLLKPTLVTNSNNWNLVCNKNLKFADFSCLFFSITIKLFLFIELQEFKRKMGVFDNFFKILPISSFRCKILISRLLFLLEIKRIRINWCPRLGGLQELVWLRCERKATSPEAVNEN